MPVTTRRMARALAAPKPDISQEQQVETDPAIEQRPTKRRKLDPPKRIGVRKSLRLASKAKAKEESLDARTSSVLQHGLKGKKTVAVTIYHLPIELIGEIMWHLRELERYLWFLDEDKESLVSCTQVCRLWKLEAQRLLYRDLTWTMQHKLAYSTKLFSNIQPQRFFRYTHTFELRRGTMNILQFFDFMTHCTALRKLVLDDCSWEHTAADCDQAREKFPSPICKLDVLEIRHAECSIGEKELVLIIRLLQAEVIRLLEAQFRGWTTHFLTDFEDDVFCKSLTVVPWDRDPLQVRPIVSALQKARLRCGSLKFTLDIGMGSTEVSCLRSLLARLGQNPEFKSLHLIFCQYEGAKGGGSGLELSSLPALEHLTLEIENPLNTSSLLKSALNEVLRAPGRDAPVLNVQLGVASYYLSNISSWDAALCGFSRGKISSFKLKVSSSRTFRAMIPFDEDEHENTWLNMAFETTEFESRRLKRAEKTLVRGVMPRLQATGLLKWV